MTDAELMAVAVLKGDYKAALLLADEVTETVARDPELRIPPVHRVTVTDRSRLRVVVYASQPPDGGEPILDTDSLINGIEDWLTNGGPLMLYGIDRLELFELPPADPPPPVATPGRDPWDGGTSPI